MSNLDHLADDVLALLDASPERRANYMLADRFVTHDRLKPILEFIEFLRFAPQKTRASGLVVYGKPGSGKTMLAQAAIRRFPREAASETSAASRPVVMISMTGAREAKTLYNRLLASLDCPLSAGSSGADRERLVLRLCRAAEVKLLIVDEIQDILSSTPRQQRLALDTVKFLMNELSIPIVALGTLAAKNAMEVDEHLNARFQYRQLPVWQSDEYLSDFLSAMERRLPLRERSDLGSPTLMKLLVNSSKGTLDTIVRLVTHAAAHAVESGKERITPELISRAESVPPVAAIRAGTAALAPAAA